MLPFSFLLISTFLLLPLPPSLLIFFFLLSYLALQPKSQGTLGSQSPTDCLPWVYGLAPAGWRKRCTISTADPTLNDFPFLTSGLFPEPNQTLLQWCLYLK